MPTENQSPRITKPLEATLPGQRIYTNEPNFPQRANQANLNNPWSLFDLFCCGKIGFVWVSFSPEMGRSKNFESSALVNSSFPRTISPGEPGGRQCYEFYRYRYSACATSNLAKNASSDRAGAYMVRFLSCPALATAGPLH